MQCTSKRYQKILLNAIYEMHPKKTFASLKTGNPFFLNNTKRIRNGPAGIYLLKANNRNTRTRCEICSKLTINTPERHLVTNI